MALTLHYLDVVKVDIIEAKDWYKKQKPGLEKEFAREIKKCILRLKKIRLATKLNIEMHEPHLPKFFPMRCIFISTKLHNRL
jgi:hypothetical protein